MTRRGALNLLLLLLALALGAVAYFQPGRDQGQEGGQVPLTALRAGDLSHLVVRRDGQVRVELRRQGERWRLLQPVEADADPFRAEQLARLAEAPSLARFPASGRDLAPYGLDRPALEVELDGLRLAFGKTTPVGSRRYVRLGEVIHLVEDLYYYDASAEPLAFVDKALLPEGARLEALELPGLSLRRTAEGGWRLEPPRGGVSSDRLEELVQAWREARAWSVRRPEGQRPDEPPQARLHLAGGEVLRYLVVAREPDLVLVRPDLDLAYHLDASQARRLLELPSGEGEERDSGGEGSGSTPAADAGG